MSKLWHWQKLWLTSQAVPIDAAIIQTTFTIKSYGVSFFHVTSKICDRPGFDSRSSTQIWHGDKLVTVVKVCYYYCSFHGLTNGFAYCFVKWMTTNQKRSFFFRWIVTLVWIPFFHSYLFKVVILLHWKKSACQTWKPINN